jgi:hypothetical protein
MLKRACLLLFVVCPGLTGFDQTTDEVRPPEPGRLVEREIAQTHPEYHLPYGQAELESRQLFIGLMGFDPRFRSG